MWDSSFSSSANLSLFLHPRGGDMSSLKCMSKFPILSYLSYVELVGRGFFQFGGSRS